jgi:hypothetical protein
LQAPVVTKGEGAAPTPQLDRTMSWWINCHFSIVIFQTFGVC